MRHDSRLKAPAPTRERPRNWLLPLAAAALITTAVLAGIGIVDRAAMYVISGALVVVLGSRFSLLVAKEIRRSR